MPLAVIVNWLDWGFGFLRAVFLFRRHESQVGMFVPKALVDGKYGLRRG